jgi:hypothetical protein
MIYNHFYFLDSRGVSGRLILGGGIYLGEYSETREDLTITAADTSTVEKSIDARRSFLALHLGVAFELNLGQHLALFAEVMGRWVNFKDITGESVRSKNGETTDEKEGDLLYLVDGETSEGIFWIGEFDDPWIGDTAHIRMNGLALRVGLKITFGKK